MSVRFRITRVVLSTTDGEVEYKFTNDLTVLAGPTGVGKTTLLELIKFGFGLDATIAPVATDHIESVTLEMRIGYERLRLARSLDPTKKKKVRVTDLSSNERLPDQHTDHRKQPALNSLLMEALGLPDDMRAAAGGKSTREGDLITFGDIFHYLYVPQGQINRDIAHSQDNYRKAKRRIVFELLFDLTDRDILNLASKLNKLRGEIVTAETRYNTVITFLRDSGTKTREEAQVALEVAARRYQEAQLRMAALRQRTDPVSDRKTRVLRDMLTQAEFKLAELNRADTETRRRRNECIAETARVQADLDRLGRMREAGQRLASIEFSVCPRCMQSVTHRSVPESSCRLCLQNETIVDDHGHTQYEIEQLTGQLAEMAAQIRVLDDHRESVAAATREREQLVAELNMIVEERTSKRISPRLQEFTDTAQESAAAQVDEQHMESIIRQWETVDELRVEVDDLRSEYAVVEGRHSDAVEAVEERRTEIIEEISEEFDAMVRAIGIPDIETARIDRTTYLPVINETPFHVRAKLAGGTTTATQVAYWCSLMAVALRNVETPYPAFLLIDSPRMGLNTANSLAAEMYRVLTTQVAAVPGRLQVIIADNELPTSYIREYAQLSFDYDNPTVSTIEHPGPSSVDSIHQRNGGRPDSVT
ncbi:AAA family ATPase [Nocardia sp. CY41]|uniref:AAA family ATPase n=1 Tax=Nocardia sp. CY41 TaxID=2608686 RepID=UPI001356D214|nr:AAA family ATPase [Nocardia sp. CY41]